MAKHHSDAGRRAPDRPAATGPARHAGSSGIGCCEPIALLGCGAGGERVWLGRSPRDGEILAVVGDGPGCALMPAMDIHGPPGAAGCGYCGAAETHLRRRCARCGSDLSGIALESGPDTTREALRQRAAEAATGRYQLLGDIPRAEGGGLFFVGRALDGSGLVGLRLERRLQVVNGRESHALVPVQPLAAVDPGRGFVTGAPRAAVRNGAAANVAGFARPRAAAPRHSPMLPVLLPVADAAERGIGAGRARSTPVPDVGREHRVPARDRLPLAAYAGALGIALLGALAFGRGPSRSAAEGGEIAALGTQPAAQGAARRAASAAAARPVPAGAVSASRRVVPRPVYGGEMRTAPLVVRGADAPGPRERTVGLAAARPTVGGKRGSAPDAEATGPVRVRTRAPGARAAVERRGARRARGAPRAAAGATRASTGTPRRAVAATGTPGDAWRGKPMAAVRRAALLGDGSAQAALGLAYERGEGVRRDDREALAWFRKAADHGDAWTRNHLGWLLANGRGTAANAGEAVRLFRLAAMQGNAEAEFNLGFMYASGRGVARSEQEAVSWYRRAARHGLAAARAELQRLGAAP